MTDWDGSDFWAHESARIFLRQSESLRHGGRVIFSDAFSDLDKIYRDIIHEMKSHYVMLYQSDEAGDSSQRSRNVEISTRRVPGKIFIDISR